MRWEERLSARIFCGFIHTYQQMDYISGLVMCIMTYVFICSDSAHCAGFEQAIQSYAIHVLSLTYQKVPRPILAEVRRNSCLIINLQYSLFNYKFQYSLFN
jgi:hypothetical protein